MDGFAAARSRHSGDEVEPAERLPKTRPFRLQLERSGCAIGVGADRKESGVAEIEQAGKSDDDVKPQCQRRESERICSRIDVGVVAVHNRKQKRRGGDEENRDMRPGSRRDASEAWEGGRYRPRPRPEDFCCGGLLVYLRHSTIWSV